MNFNPFSGLNDLVYNFLLYLQSLLEEKEDFSQKSSFIECPNCQYGEMELELSRSTNFLQCPHCAASYFRIGRMLYLCLLADQLDNPNFQKVINFANLQTQLSEFGLRVELSGQSPYSDPMSEEATFDLFDRSNPLFRNMPLQNFAAFLECYKLNLLREASRS